MNTQQLRQKILDLAIRGQLVPQDENDEPAQVLLEKIRAEKDKNLPKKGKKKSVDADKSPYKNEEESPFQIPENWAWCKLGEIFEIVTGATPSKNNSEFYGNDFPFFKPTDLDNGYFVNNAQDNLSKKGFEISRKLPKKSILVTCIGATIGKTGFIRVEGTCNQQINAIVPNIFTSSEYIYFLCNSSYFQNEIIENASATTLPIINKSKFEKLVFPLPPLSEQVRIVSKIEEVFALIDTIEQNQSDLKTTIEKTKAKVLDMAIRGELLNDENRGLEISDNEHYTDNLPKGWKVCYIKDIAKTIPSKSHQILQSEIKNIGKIPVISQSSSYIEGYSNDFNKVFQVDNFVIVFGDHTRNVKYIDFNFIVGADGVKIIYPNENMTKYIYYLLLNASKKITDRGYSRHYQFLQKYPLNIPPLEEQQKIVKKIEEIFSVLEEIETNICN